MQSFDKYCGDMRERRWIPYALIMYNTSGDIKHLRKVTQEWDQYIKEKLRRGREHFIQIGFGDWQESRSSQVELHVGIKGGKLRLCGRELVLKTFQEQTQAHLSKAGFLNLGTVNILDCVILCPGGCLGFLRMFSSIPNHYQLDASNSTPLRVMTAICALGGGGEVVKLPH